MNAKVMIATGASVGVGASLLLADFFFQVPIDPHLKLATSEHKNIYTGPAIDVSYGKVQVQITVENGRITDARALKAPGDRSSIFSEYAIPALREQTLAAQSADINGATGASFTSFGWKTSLAAALKAANL